VAQRIRTYTNDSAQLNYLLFSRKLRRKRNTISSLLGPGERGSDQNFKLPRPKVVEEEPDFGLSPFTGVLGKWWTNYDPAVSTVCSISCRFGQLRRRIVSTWLDSMGGYGVGAPCLSITSPPSFRFVGWRSFRVCVLRDTGAG
jgi:hypothetical protein